MRNVGICDIEIEGWLGYVLRRVVVKYERKWGLG